MTNRFQQKQNILNQPGHSVSMQERFSRDGPSQYLPPYWVGGESQLLSLNCTPPPQDTLQVEYLDHFPNPPFTGHSLIKHSRVSVLLPTQSAPPFDGAGLSHFLVRLWIPPPQDWEHFEYSDHRPNSPSIGT